MYVIPVRNVHEALHKAIRAAECSSMHTRTENSRNGMVKEFLLPVTTVYTYPKERVLFYPKRNANPFFHFFESLWMLAGRDDVKFVSYFNKRMKEYSDDGEKFHAAYGYRWRRFFDGDQLEIIIDILKKDPLSRRAVLGMWDPRADLGFSGKDFPCNMIITFQLRNNELDMRVHNRSNDLIWGAYGANAVHMSVLQEYVASRLGVEVGTYFQISDNLHIYLEPEVTTNTIEEIMSNDIEYYNYYAENIVEPFPLFDPGADPEKWNRDLWRFFSIIESDSVDLLSNYEHKQFFGLVALPMFLSWKAHKEKKPELALEYCKTIKAKDWAMACEQWLRRVYASR